MALLAFICYNLYNKTKDERNFEYRTPLQDRQYLFLFRMFPSFVFVCQPCSFSQSFLWVYFCKCLRRRSGSSPRTKTKQKKNLVRTTRIFGERIACKILSVHLIYSFIYSVFYSPSLKGKLRYYGRGISEELWYYGHGDSSSSNDSERDESICVVLLTEILEGCNL